METPRAGGGVHAPAVRQELDQEPGLRLDGGAEPEPGNAWQAVQRLIRRFEDRLKCRELERAAHPTLRRVKPPAPVDTIGVARAAKVQQHDTSGSVSGGRARRAPRPPAPGAAPTRPLP